MSHREFKSHQNLSILMCQCLWFRHRERRSHSSCQLQDTTTLEGVPCAAKPFSRLECLQFGKAAECENSEASRGAASISFLRRHQVWHLYGTPYPGGKPQRCDSDPQGLSLLWACMWIFERILRTSLRSCTSPPSIENSFA